MFNNRSDLVHLNTENATSVHFSLKATADDDDDHDAYFKLRSPMSTNTLCYQGVFFSRKLPVIHDQSHSCSDLRPVCVTLNGFPGISEINMAVWGFFFFLFCSITPSFIFRRKETVLFPLL